MIISINSINTIGEITRLSIRQAATQYAILLLFLRYSYDIHQSDTPTKQILVGDADTNLSTMIAGGTRVDTERQ